MDCLLHIISTKDVAADLKNIEVVKNWPVTYTIKELKGFLGLTRYYRQFVKEFNIIGKSLTDLLKKNIFNWNDRAQEAFD